MFLTVLDEGGGFDFANFHVPLDQFIMPRSWRPTIALFSGRKFRVGWATCERPKFESFSRCVVSCGVKVRLSEDDHPDIGVQVDLSRLGAGQPKVDEVSQPLSRVRVAVTLIAGHVKRSLSQEGLRGWRHVGKVVHHHKHLDHGAQRVEERELQGAFCWHPVAFLSKVDMTQVG